MVNKIYCGVCNVFIHEFSIWKHNRSDKHLNNLRYEQIDNNNDIVEIPEWLFREKRIRQLVNPFHLKNPLRVIYNVTLIHHNPIDHNSELK